MIDGVRQMLDFLEANPEVDLPHDFGKFSIWFLFDKEPFLATVKAFGTLEKEVKGKELHAVKTFGPARLVAEINQEKICTKKTVKRLVDVEEYDCEPLLSQVEIQQLGQEAAIS